VVIQEFEQLIDVFRFTEAVHSAPRQLGECFVSGHKDSEWAVLWVVQGTVEATSLDEQLKLSIRLFYMRDRVEDCSEGLGKAEHCVNDVDDTVGGGNIGSSHEGIVDEDPVPHVD